MRGLAKLPVLLALALAGLFAVTTPASAVNFKPSPGGAVTFAEPDALINEIATGDLDGNGFDDLVATGMSNRIQVMLADDDGEGFTPAPGSPFGTGTSVSRRLDVFVGDFGGSDALDLLVEIPTFPGQFETFLGSGDGTFGQDPDFVVSPPMLPPDYPTLAGGNAVGDVNGDGFPDLVAGMTKHQFMVALGTATGQFNLTAATPVNVPTDESATDGMFNQAALGDWNGDGNVDVAFGLDPVFSNTSPIGIYSAHGDGDGGFSPAAGNPVITESSAMYITSMSRLDLNGNVWEDLAFTAPNSSSLRTLVGSPAGLVVSGNPNGMISNLNYPFSTAVADLTGDLRDDVAVTLRGDNSLTVAINEPPGSLLLPPNGPFALPPIGGSRFAPNNIATGDFNGDGVPDLASSSSHSADLNQARGVDVLINSPESATAPDFLAFPVTRVATAADPQRITLTSVGAVPLAIEGVSVTEYGTNSYWADASDCPAQLPPGDSCDIVVGFTPDSFGTQGAQLSIEFGGATAAESIPIIGETYRIEPSALDFGEAEIGEGLDREPRTLTVSSSDQMPVEAAQVTGTDSGSFRSGARSCTPAADACSFEVIFDPKSGSAGPRQATLDLTGPGNDPVATVPLTGTAVRPVPPVTRPKLALKLKSPRKIKRGKTLTVTAVVKNVGDVAARPLNIRVTAPKRFAKAPKVVQVSSLAPGKSVTRKLRIKVKRTARKGKKLKVKVTATSGKVKKTATRAVKVR